MNWEKIAISSNDLDLLCAYRNGLARRLGEAEEFVGDDGIYLLPKATAEQVRKELEWLKRPKWKLRRRYVPKGMVSGCFQYDVIDPDGKVVEHNVNHWDGEGRVERENAALAAGGVE